VDCNFGYLEKANTAPASSGQKAGRGLQRSVGAQVGFEQPFHPISQSDVDCN
jgi:hypothetical protein